MINLDNKKQQNKTKIYAVSEELCFHLEILIQDPFTFNCFQSYKMCGYWTHADTTVYIELILICLNFINLFLKKCYLNEIYYTSVSS